MENLKAIPRRREQPASLRRKASLLALTGQPGAGVSTVTRLLCSEYGALMISMGAIPKIAHQMSLGLYPESEEALWSQLDYRLAGERRDNLLWIRPFHRRLTWLLHHGSSPRIVINGILTPRELAYCRRMGARLIHLTAPEAVRRQRIGLRYPDPPHPGLTLLDRLMASRPQSWDLILDTDEPYLEFVKSFKALLGAF